ncbi:MAG TPA: hypothetical protein DEB70_00830 [Planctomycetaceae bacterium]|nr:hypothetical protein [Planctomycetaceae bacterium]
MTSPVSHYRIPCPSDHIVMVPARLLGEELICPQCNSRFVADFVASVEYSDEQTERAAYQWLVIAIGTVVVLITAGIIALTSQLLQ